MTDSIKRNLYLKKFYTGEIQGPLTGYPSIDKPWLACYDEQAIKREISKKSILEFIKERNSDKLNNIAINYYGNEINFETFFKKIDNAAKSFQKLGVKKGDVVTVLTMTNPELEITLYALNKLGAIINMIDVRWDAKKICENVEETNSKILIIMDNFLENAEEIIKNTSIVENIVSISPYNSLPKSKKQVISFIKRKEIKKFETIAKNISARVPIYKWNSFINLGTNIILEETIVNCDDIVAYVHTGGTTGVSKTVELTNYNFNAMVTNFEAFNAYEPGDKFLNDIVPFVAYGLLGALHLPLCLGLTNIIAPILNPEEFTDFMMKYKPNNVLSVPTYWDDFINSKKTKGKDLSFIKHPGSGGDATSAEKEIQLNSYFKDHNSEAIIELGYGMTEVGSAASACVGKINEIGSVGVPLVNNIFKIVNTETNEELQYDQVGEIYLLTPTTMKGYLNNPEEENNLFKIDQNGNKWIRSGDLGYINEKGFLYIVGRKKRMLIRGGFKLYPSSIENTILKNNLVDECCVVGTDSYEFGTEPIAYVKLKQDIKEELKELKKQILLSCKAELPEYSQPYDIEFIEEIPLTPIGKIDYKLLEKKANENYSTLKQKR